MTMHEGRGEFKKEVDQVIERVYVKREITAEEGRRILGVSKNKFYELASKYPKYQERKSRLGGIRDSTLSEKKKRLERQLQELALESEKRLAELTSSLNQKEKELEDAKTQLKQASNTIKSLKDHNEKAYNMNCKLGILNDSLRKANAELKLHLSDRNEGLPEVMETVENDTNNRSRIKGF